MIRFELYFLNSNFDKLFSECFSKKNKNNEGYRKDDYSYETAFYLANIKKFLYLKVASTKFNEEFKYRNI